MIRRHSTATPSGADSRSNNDQQRGGGGGRRNNQPIIHEPDDQFDNDGPSSQATPLIHPPSPPGRSGSLLEVMNGSHDDSSAPRVHHRRTSTATSAPASLMTAVGSHPQSQHQHHPAAAALPGRPTRRKKAQRAARGRGHHGFCYRLYHRWCRSSTNTTSSSSTSGSSPHSNLWVAVALWYSLGVISIGTSKVLLSDHELGSLVGNVPPMYLTLQQLLIGSTLLRFWIVCGSSSSCIQPWPVQSSVTTAAAATSNSNSVYYYDNHHYLGKTLRHRSDLNADAASASASASLRSLRSWNALRGVHPSLLWAALFFALGFLLTNLGFSGAPASFVETVKASEPITSASVAVWWKIESLTGPEAASLLAIVTGVALSTAGNHSPRGAPTAASVSASAASSSTSSVWSCFVILLSNLCFSFRGLHQKLFRATPEGSTGAVDDWNLQFRMQQLGAAGLVLPVLLWEGRTLWNAVWHATITMPLQQGEEAGLGASVRLMAHYVLLSLCNGCAFTFYNLSSTYILSRISVVHHAALNCIRRVFAIIVTSLLFRVPMTVTGALGILCSVVGFMAFSHFKIQKQQQRSLLHSQSSYLPTSTVTSTPSLAR